MLRLITSIFQSNSTNKLKYINHYCQPQLSVIIWHKKQMRYFLKEMFCTTIQLDIISSLSLLSSMYFYK